MRFWPALTLSAAVLAIASAATATHVIVVNPLAASGTLAPGFTKTGTVSGKCWTRSLASTRANAWRCMAGNQIHDPCFVASGNAACVTDARKRQVVMMTLTQPLPKEAIPKMVAQPWMIELSNGDVCNYATGLTSVTNGMRWNYACNSGGWALGDPNRSKPLWTIAYLKSDKAKTPTNASIVTAYF